MPGKLATVRSGRATFHFRQRGDAGRPAPGAVSPEVLSSSRGTNDVGTCRLVGRLSRHLAGLLMGLFVFLFSGHRCLGHSVISRGFLTWGLCQFVPLTRPHTEHTASLWSRPTDLFLVWITLLVAFLKVTKTFSCVLWFYASYLGLDSISLTFLQKVCCTGQGSRPACNARLHQHHVLKRHTFSTRFPLPLGNECK